MKAGDYFLIRLKFPLAPWSYRLTFSVAALEMPEMLVEHPLDYMIFTTESCLNILGSLDHLLYRKFGFASQPAQAQPYGITIITPAMHTVKADYVYFLVHVDSSKLKAESPPFGRAGSTLFSRLSKVAEAASKESAKAVDLPGILGPGSQSKPPLTPIGNSSGGSPSSRRMKVKGMMPQTPPVGMVGVLQDTLGKHLGHAAQDAAGRLHFDLVVFQVSADGHSVNERYVVSLWPRPSFPEFYEGSLSLGDRDITCKVELVFRPPDNLEKVPLKIGDWSIVSKETHIPQGF